MLPDAPRPQGAAQTAARNRGRIGGATPTYDANGNLTSDGTTTYSWDARDQLSSLTGTTNASFSYDGFGRRASTTIAGTTTDYLYDGDNLVQELTGGTPTANLLTGLGIDEVFSRTDSNGTRSFLTDALGSTLALTDDTGTEQTTYTYDPFGNPSASGASDTNTQQYTGRETDGTGLQYNRARYYSPTLQRFISEDLLGFGGGDANLYAYVGNDPLNATDPSGEFIELAGQCLIGAAINAGFGYATSSLAGRKYSWGDAGRDAALGCAIAVFDPFAILGEGSALVGNVAEDGGFVAAGELSSSLASGGEEAAVAFEGESAVADTVGDVAGTCSFSGGTPVATASGETPIDQLQPGDQVEAYDPATGTTGPQTITAVWAHTDQTIETVTVDGEQIETTPEHPFYVEGAGWVLAGDLWAGATIRRENGQSGIVQQITFSKHAEVMYNLTVETAHTFFVGVGQWLVHNNCGGGSGWTGGNSHTVTTTRINRNLVRVDVEFPTGGSTGNVHVQVKGPGGPAKYYVNNPNDLPSLPSSIRKNGAIVSGIQRRSGCLVDINRKRYGEPIIWTTETRVPRDR